MVAIDPSAIVAANAELYGDVRIGEETFVHPSVRIIARHGPIAIGKRCIIEEQVVIINERAAEMVIGNDTFVGVAAYIESSNIGNDNMIEPMSRILNQSATGDGCSIGVRAVITAGSIPSGTSLQPPSYDPAVLSDDVRLHTKTSHKTTLQYLTTLGIQLQRWTPPLPSPQNADPDRISGSLLESR